MHWIPSAWNHQSDVLEPVICAISDSFQPWNDKVSRKYHFLSWLSPKFATRPENTANFWENQTSTQIWTYVWSNIRAKVSLKQGSNRAQMQTI
jgi:hypothetical protein